MPFILSKTNWVDSLQVMLDFANANNYLIERIDKEKAVAYLKCLTSPK